MDGMKNNMMFMVSNMVMIGWISYFFSGFVLVKVPFPLTMTFKSMLQRGISLAYVSTDTLQQVVVDYAFVLALSAIPLCYFELVCAILLTLYSHNALVRLLQVIGLFLRVHLVLVFHRLS